MTTTGVVVDEDGHEANGVLRSNRIVSFTVGRMTRHISLDDFAEVGLLWKPFNESADMISPECCDQPQFDRSTS